MAKDNNRTYFELLKAVLRHPRWVNAEDAAVGAWLRLLAYCAEQGNGGVLRDPINSDRGWLTLCGANFASVKAAVDCGLIAMSDDRRTFTVLAVPERGGGP